MTDIPKAFDGTYWEDDIYKKWEESQSFSPKFKDKKEYFSIVMPPPNATGTLHLGHAVMLALEDIFVRYKRMQNCAVLWTPGTDHAAIATQNKVEQLLAKNGKKKEDLGRENFLEEVKKFVAESQKVIRLQIRKMGASCDWTKEKYTMDKDVSAVVKKIFVNLYNDGLIYRGKRIVNWCPRCMSTLADDEVTYEEREEKLYWINYGPFVLATTRPETKLGDTAVAVHPSDKRYKKMIGKKYMIPGVLGDFEIIVVADKSVDPTFGSGAIKVTPAHSFADFEIALRHKLPFIKIIDEKGLMMANCGKYAGMTTEECRKQIVEDMKEKGLLAKIENYKHNLSTCYRCGTVIEPLISEQWFIDVNKKVLKEGKKLYSLKEKAIEVVRKKEIKIVPDRFNATYFHWLENLRDWCVSRQIWWGHQIPVWYCETCGEIIVREETPSSCPKCHGAKLRQDKDTLDTWFSSGLWTFSTLGWPQKNDLFKYFHPTSILETGYDILFFWVARMILLTTYATKQIPFKTVYLHGLVRDKLGRKMSKSLGNGIDPLSMIAKFGADSVRLSLIIGSTPGNDLRLYEEKIAGFRNFVNKIWNAGRFALLSLSEEEKKLQKINPKKLSLFDKWILSKLNAVIKASTKAINDYRLSDAGQLIYDFFWNDFCAWYIEISKGLRNPEVLVFVLKNCLKLLHPFVPFVTEAIWSYFESDSLLINELWPKENKKFLFKKETQQAEKIIELITGIRSLRQDHKIEARKKISALIYSKNKKLLEDFYEIIKKFSCLSDFSVSKSGPKPKNAVFKILPDLQIFLLNFEDKGEKKAKLEAEIEELQIYIEKLNKNLNNPNFIKKAPPSIVLGEKEKLKKALLNLENLKKQA